MTDLPHRLRFSQAIGLVFRTAAKHWRACLAITAAYAVLSGLVDAVSRGSTGSLDPTVLEPGEVAAAGVEAILAFVAFLLVNVVVQPVTLGALSLVGSAAVYGDQINTGGIVRRALDRAVDAIAATLVLFLMLVVPFVLVGMAALTLTLLGGAVGAVGGFSIVIFGLFVVGIPLLYLFVRFSLAIPIVMREGRGPIDALKRSWQLVRGAWWWVFGVGVVVGLVIIVVNTVLSFRSFFGADTAADYLVGFVKTAISTAIGSTLFGIATGVVYASRVPEDTLPPDVVASEARLDEEAAPVEPPTPPTPPAPVEQPDPVEPPEPVEPPTPPTPPTPPVPPVPPAPPAPPQ